MAHSSGAEDVALGTGASDAHVVALAATVPGLSGEVFGAAAAPTLVGHPRKVLEHHELSEGTGAPGAGPVAAPRLRQVQVAPGAGEGDALRPVGEGRRGWEDHGARRARPPAVVAVAGPRLGPERVLRLALALRGAPLAARLHELVPRRTGPSGSQRVAAFGFVVELRQVRVAAAAQGSRQHQLAPSARTPRVRLVASLAVCVPPDSRHKLILNNFKKGRRHEKVF